MKSPKKKPTAAKLRTWRVSILRQRAHHLARKGEITGHQNERDFPHLVELPLPPGGFHGQLSEFDAFHRDRGLPVRRGRGRNGAEQFYVRSCDRGRVPRSLRRRARDLRAGASPAAN
jgi:hypothetical protein